MKFLLIALIFALFGGFAILSQLPQGGDGFGVI